MKCPYCNAELNENGHYGYLAQHQSGEVLGYIYKCPNSEGFENIEDILEYLDFSNQTMEDLVINNLCDIVCYSNVFPVSGSFYTDKNQNLFEGYPC